MMSPRWTRTATLVAAWTVAALPCVAGEQVALRADSGMFLRAADDGTLRADRLVPGEQETFELDGDQDGPITLKTHRGRFLLAEGRDAKQLRADSPRAEPGERETFVLVPADGGRAGMKVRGFREFVVFDTANRKPAAEDRADGPRPAETVEVFRVTQISESVRSGLALAVRMLVVQQLQGEEYDKTKVRNRKKFIKLPAPTLADPGRMKKHQILGVREEYRVTARLDGMPEIRITQMPYLRSYLDGQTGVLLFVAQIDVPVRGRVRYQIADAVTAETGFRTKIAMKMVCQFRAKKVDDEVILEPPEVLQLGIDVRALDVSNDALSVVRGQIEALINDEIRKKRTRILQQANKGICKAIDVQEFRYPLVRYLALP